jgi:hypothetical protein
MSSFLSHHMRRFVSIGRTWNPLLTHLLAHIKKEPEFESVTAAD